MNLMEHHHHHPHSGHEHHHQHSRHKKGGVTLTIRAVAGLSGDMLLAGLAGVAGLKSADLAAYARELKIESLNDCIKLEERSVNAVSGLGCGIDLPHEHAHRSFKDIREIIEKSDLPDAAGALAVKTFAVLAEAEAAVHGKEPESVTFHEVGALDSILDICLASRIFCIIAPERFVCSPLPLADGVIDCAHGKMLSPAPAVLRLLNDVQVCGFSGVGETVTPTAIALLKAMGAEFGQWPDMTVKTTVIAYGGKVFENAPNGAVFALGES